MKKNRKLPKVLFLAAFMAMAIIAIAGMNMSTLINSEGLNGTEKKTLLIDTSQENALSKDSIKSSVFGTGLMGSPTNYGVKLNQTKTLATSATRIVTMDLNDGYYSQIKVDTTDMYNAAVDDGRGYARFGYFISIVTRDGAYAAAGSWASGGDANSPIKFYNPGTSTYKYSTREISFKKAGRAQVYGFCQSKNNDSGCGYISYNGNVVMSGTNTNGIIFDGPVTTSDKFVYWATPPSTSGGMQCVRNHRQILQ